MTTSTEAQPETTGAQPLVTMTPLAAQKARDLIAQKELAEGALRVFVVGGGCSGYQYGMALAPEAEPGDTVVESEGVRIVVDAESTTLIGGAEIDFVEDLMKSGFTIYNPNATQACACGTSFSTGDGGGAARPCG